MPRDVLDKDIIAALTASDVPLGAYQLATTLKEQYHGVPVVSVYRALDRLVAEGALQRVETLSAYRVADAGSDLLLVCGSCGRIEALTTSTGHDTVSSHAALSGFSIQRIVREAFGLCRSCRSDGG